MLRIQSARYEGEIWVRGIKKAPDLELNHLKLKGTGTKGRENKMIPLERLGEGGPLPSCCRGVAFLTFGNRKKRKGKNEGRKR